MNIAVDGFRGSSADWEAVRSLPADQLPTLTEGQREVAKKLGIPEDDYARSYLAGSRNQEKMLRKTERLARLLEDRLKAVQQARVRSVTLRTIDERFEVELEVDGVVVPIRIDEHLVDSYFESGSVDAEQDLARVLDRALTVRVR